MMPTQAALDFSPLLRLLLLGILIALGPLAWVWLRHRQTSLPQRLRALTLLTLFLTFDLVLFGAFTRLTDSGLGCPDWPGCYGHASPLGATAQISAEQAALPSGPVTHSKAWIEMMHRYLASGVGVLIVVLAASTWVHRRQEHISPWWPTLTLLWVLLQGAFGALTVTMKLFPAIVSLHLLGGMVLLALLQKQATHYMQVPSTALSQPMRFALIVCFALLWMQIALGAWVSTNYAVLACTQFPLCQGQWMPHMDLQQGFEVWRALGKTSAGDNINFQALTAIHIVHRVFAFLVFAAVAWTAWQLRQYAALRGVSRGILALLLWQFATGLSNVVLGWPLIAAVAHTGGAAGLVMLLTAAMASTDSSAPVATPSAASDAMHADMGVSTRRHS